MPVVLADGEKEPLRLTVRDRQAYWATGDGTVRTCNVSDCAGTLRTMASGYPRASRPAGITATAAHVYWTLPLQYVVHRIPLEADGGTPEEYPAYTIGNGNLPNGLATDGARIYWASWSPDRVLSCPTTGGCTDASAFEVSRTPPEHDFTRWIAVNADAVFWTAGDADNPKGAVFRAAKGGGPAVALRYDMPGPRAIAVHKDAVFVTSWLAPNGGANGVVYRIVGTSSDELAGGQPQPESIATDGLPVEPPVFARLALCGSIGAYRDLATAAELELRALEPLGVRGALDVGAFTRDEVARIERRRPNTNRRAVTASRFEVASLRPSGPEGRWWALVVVDVNAATAARRHRRPNRCQSECTRQPESHPRLSPARFQDRASRDGRARDGKRSSSRPEQRALCT